MQKFSHAGRPLEEVAFFHLRVLISFKKQEMVFGFLVRRSGLHVSWQGTRKFLLCISAFGVAFFGVNAFSGQHGPSLPQRAPLLISEMSNPIFALDVSLHKEKGAHEKVSAALPLLSKEARNVLGWVRRSNNHSKLPFLLVDKRAATVHVFTAEGLLQGSSPVLLGMASGDESPAGIGERPMSQIAPHERITPAGRFSSEPGRNLQGDDIVWIDYNAAVSLHRLRPSKAAERRPQRLASPTTSDNRISYGCVNVDPAFYDRFVAPTFGWRVGVIYVLPETRSAASFFSFGPAAVP